MFVVSDGEIQDATTLPPSLTRGVANVVLPRDTVPNAALLEVVLSRRVTRDDSNSVTLVIGTWGDLGTTAATVEVFSGARRLVRRPVTLPPTPGRR